MKQKMIFLALTLFVLSAASANAQVRIGGETDPNTSAVLDLNADNNTNAGKLGLALPRVKLTSTTDVETIKSPATGLVVYNTLAAGSGTTAVVKGLYIYDGKWIPVLVSEADAEIGNEVTNATPDGGLVRSISMPYTLGIVDNGVTAVRIKADAVDSTKIKDKSIGSADIANNAVITDNIRNANVTTAKLVDGAVTAVKLNAMGAANGQVLRYNGTAWAPANATPVAITTHPKAFSWSRLKETNGDPNGQATATITALKVTATGTGTLTYQWYQKSVNRNTPDIKLTGATNATYTPVVTDWGMKSYYCVVKNGNDSVVSTIADVAIGCGAKTSQGRWLRFMCHNLGADTSLDPFTYTSINDTTSKDSKGWLFQWGRIADGHQWRSSDTITGPYNSITSIQVPSGNKMYGKFIKNPNMATFYDWRTPQFDRAWRNSGDLTYQSCPSGWRMPTSDEWGSLYRDGTSFGNPADATANVWTWTANGYLLKPDGAISTLFLPAAGYRGASAGGVTALSNDGNYWCSMSASTHAYYLLFHSNFVSAWSSVERALAMSVRCISTTLD